MCMSQATLTVLRPENATKVVTLQELIEAGTWRLSSCDLRELKLGVVDVQPILYVSCLKMT